MNNDASLFQMIFVYKNIKNRWLDHAHVTINFAKCSEQNLKFSFETFSFNGLFRRGSARIRFVLDWHFFASFLVDQEIFGFPRFGSILKHEYGTFFVYEEPTANQTSNSKHDYIDK